MLLIASSHRDIECGTIDHVVTSGGLLSVLRDKPMLQDLRMLLIYLWFCTSTIYTLRLQFTVSSGLLHHCTEQPSLRLLRGPKPQKYNGRLAVNRIRTKTHSVFPAWENRAGGKSLSQNERFHLGFPQEGKECLNPFQLAKLLGCFSSVFGFAQVLFTH